MPVEPLPPQALRRDPSPLLPKFKSTEEVTAASSVIGQDRALAAIEFSAGMQHNGYNLFVMGPAGVGRHSVLTQFLEERSKAAPTPADWVYVHNFQTPHQPNALELPTGRGTELKRRMESLIEELNSSIPSIFESDEYRTRRNAIRTEIEQRHETVFESLRKKAVEKDIVMMQTPQGFAFAPVREGEVMRPEVFQKLSDEERKKIQDVIEELQTELQAILEKLPRWDKERRDSMRTLNREVAMYAVSHALEEVRKAFSEHAECQKYLDDVQSELIDNIDIFIESDEAVAQRALAGPVPDGATRRAEALRRYSVNVIVDNGKTRGAPVVREDNPLLLHLHRTGRAPGAIRRPGHGFHADQTRLDPPRQRRLSDHRRREAADPALRLGHAEAHAPRPGSAHRIARRSARHDLHGLARAGADSLQLSVVLIGERQHLLPAEPARSGFRRSVQGRRRLRRDAGLGRAEHAALRAR